MTVTLVIPPNKLEHDIARLVLWVMPKMSPCPRGVSCVHQALTQTKRGWQFVPHVRLAGLHSPSTHWIIVTHAPRANMLLTLGSPVATTAMSDFIFPPQETETALIVHLEHTPLTKEHPCVHSAPLVVILLKLRLSAARIAVWGGRHLVSLRLFAMNANRAFLLSPGLVVAQHARQVP